MKSLPFKSRAVLALDWGEARVGVAVSPDFEYAFPRDHISYTTENGLLSALQSIINEDRIEIIVLGLPQNLKGEDTQTTLKVREFGKMIASMFECEVIYEDERLTSQFAEQKRVMKSQKGTDSLAALVILENYLAKR